MQLLFLYCLHQGELFRTKESAKQNDRRIPLNRTGEVNVHNLGESGEPGEVTISWEKLGSPSRIHPRSSWEIKSKYLTQEIVETFFRCILIPISPYCHIIHSELWIFPSYCQDSPFFAVLSALHPIGSMVRGIFF